MSPTVQAPRLPTYSTVLGSMSSPPTSILLGSGFSMALDARYGYASILGMAFPSSRSRVRRVFAASATSDFETVMAGMASAASYANLYGKAGRKAATQLRGDIARVARKFPRALTSCHHARVIDVLDAQYAVARQFLSGFNTLFTLNHDLLAYWAVNRGQCGAPNPPQTDGFMPSANGDLVWSQGNRQEVYYLHGGLHLYPSGADLTKMRSTPGTGATLISDVAARIGARQYPLLVLEGTTQQKLLAIRGSPYLQDALDQLGRVTGALVVFGVGISPQDTHIRERIATGQVSDVLVGIRPTSGSAQPVIAEWTGLATYRAPSNPLRPHFFDATTVNVW